MRPVVTTSAALRAVETDDLEEYPLSGQERLDSHYFIAWHHRRWLNSEMRLKATEECRALYFDLICIAQEQNPIGTLPADTEQLAKLLGVDQGRLQQLCEGSFGPLHKWRPCLCEGVVRLYHPMVLEVVTDAIARKHDNRARNEAGNAMKRRQRLRSAIAGYHVDLAANDAAILWMDEWLMEQGCGYRGASWIERAIGAWSDHQLHMHTRGGRQLS